MTQFTVTLNNHVNATNVYPVGSEAIVVAFADGTAVITIHDDQIKVHQGLIAVAQYMTTLANQASNATTYNADTLALLGITKEIAGNVYNACMEVANYASQEANKLV